MGCGTGGGTGSSFGSCSKPQTERPGYPQGPRPGNNSEAAVRYSPSLALQSLDRAVIFDQPARHSPTGAPGGCEMRQLVAFRQQIDALVPRFVAAPQPQAPAP